MVEIKKVIELFEKALPVYEKALSKKTISLKKLVELGIHKGICALFYWEPKPFRIALSTFSIRGYYKNYLTGNYLYITPEDIFDRNPYSTRLTKKKEYHESLEFRRDFLRTEIKELNKLIKQGYTHI